VFNGINYLSPRDDRWKPDLDGGILRYNQIPDDITTSGRMTIVGSNATYGGATIDTNGLDVSFFQPSATAEAATAAWKRIGPGTLTLANVNTYAGSTKVSAGSLIIELNFDDVVAASSAGLVMNGGTLVVSGPGSTTTRSQTFANGTTFSGGASTITPILAGGSSTANVLTLDLGVLTRSFGATGNIVFGRATPYEQHADQHQQRIEQFLDH